MAGAYVLHSEPHFNPICTTITVYSQPCIQDVQAHLIPGLCSFLHTFTHFLSHTFTHTRTRSHTGPKKTVVIDNSSAFRYAADVPLVIPEINGRKVVGAPIIANPNCTTAIGAMALWPIHKQYTLAKILMSTYQVTRTFVLRLQSKPNNKAAMSVICR